MQCITDTGWWKVVAGAHDNGTPGTYRDSGDIRNGLAYDILRQIHGRIIIRQKKAPKFWFIKLIGINIGLWNMSPGEVIPAGNADVRNLNRYV